MGGGGGGSLAVCADAGRWVAGVATPPCNMSELLKSYEQDFSRFLANANKKVSALSGPGNADAIVKDIKTDLMEAEKCLKQFENELRSSPANIANQYQQRLKRHQDNLSQLKRTLNNEDQRRQRKDLMGAGSDDPREKLLSANEILQDTGESLDRTLKLGLDSEQLANDTLNDLKRQRGQIIGINEKVNDVGTNVNSANRVIGRMDRRRIWMKLLMLVTIVLLLIANAVVLYIKLK